MDYHRQIYVDTRIALIFNTFGQKMSENDGRVVSNFIVQALKNEDITVYGDGTQTRSFCYVDDTVRALIALFFKDSIHEPINIGNPDEISVSQLAEEIIYLTNSKSQIRQLPLPLDDPKTRKPDISLANQILRWTPTIPRTEGLSKTIEYFKMKLSSH
jgi:UDP-glucuronate decarboxylase